MRNPIVPLRIAEIKNSSFYRGNKEEMLPSHIITKLGERVVRVGIVGTLVDKYVSDEMNYCRLTLCDDTDDIIVKVFGNLVEEAAKLDIGNIVFVAGKVKEGSYRYVNAEIIKKVDFAFESFFKLKIIERIAKNSKRVKEILKLSEMLSYEELVEECKARFEIDENQLKEILKNKASESLEETILKIIENFSNEEGISISELLNFVNIEKEKLAEIVSELQESGKIYEFKPGKYKIIK